MDFLALVEAARTCRRFDESRPLSEADLEWLVDCARLSPSARNAQELRFIIINAGKACEELFGYCRFAGALKDWNGPARGERPTAFIAVLMPEKDNNLLCYDCGIACMAIQLGATSRGQGCCIVQSFARDKAEKLLQPPAGMKIALVLALGVAAEKRVVDGARPDASLAYWRDGDNVHHVPKRPLSELIVGRF